MWSSLDTVSHVVCFYSSFIFARWENSGEHVKLLVFCAQPQTLLTCKYVTQLPTLWKKGCRPESTASSPELMHQEVLFFVAMGLTMLSWTCSWLQYFVPDSYSPFDTQHLHNGRQSYCCCMRVDSAWSPVFETVLEFVSIRILASHQSIIRCQHDMTDFVCKAGLLASYRYSTRVSWWKVTTSIKPFTSLYIDSMVFLEKGLLSSSSRLVTTLNW